MFSQPGKLLGFLLSYPCLFLRGKILQSMTNFAHTHSFTFCYYCWQWHPLPVPFGTVHIFRSVNSSCPQTLHVNGKLKDSCGSSKSRARTTSVGSSGSGRNCSSCVAS